MHIRFDLEKRKREDVRGTIGLVIGEVIQEKRRTAPIKTLEDM